MKKVAIVTATRAEYCFLIPLIKRINEDHDINLDLIVTGTHLLKEYGYSIADIISDGFPIAHEIEILSEGNTNLDVSLTMARAIEKFAHCFAEDRPDALIISGDRTEMLAVAIAGMNELIPIVHIHGGEVTQGAVDDCIRHALSKMSYIHFTSTDIYRNRVIQLGEFPDRVFNVGSLGTENVLHAKWMTADEIRKDMGIPLDSNYALVTFHPVTLEGDKTIDYALELCKAMDSRNELFYVVTGSNADAGGEIINNIMKNYVSVHSNAVFVENLGMNRYLSALKYSKYVMGNSSSGILEAPVLGVPTVNIGNRQKGRIMVDTIINCCPEKQSIIDAIDKAESMEHNRTDIYGDGTTSKKILDILKDFLFHDRIDLRKGFYDICNQENIIICTE